MHGFRHHHNGFAAHWYVGISEADHHTQPSHIDKESDTNQSAGEDIDNNHNADNDTVEAGENTQNTDEKEDDENVVNLYKNHILFTDNFYMSLNPAEIFLGHIVPISAKLLKITVSIFVRRLLMSRWKKEKYRSTDQQITTKSLFQSTEQQRTKVITNKKLCMYSTYNFLFCHSAKRCQSHKQWCEVISKPFMIKAYNIHMGGVDMVDQQLP